MITSSANMDSFHALNPNSNLNVNPTYIYIYMYVRLRWMSFNVAGRRIIPLYPSACMRFVSVRRGSYDWPSTGALSTTHWLPR